MSNNNSRNNRGRNTIFTPTQDDLISNAVKSGGFNNLKATFERLSNTLAFNGLTPLQIAKQRGFDSIVQLLSSYTNSPSTT